ncbi:MAG: hypothetical protein ACD_70C00039G0003 [uncultured bacterium]|nr:MAG: hypothetical protein ACD_70C00039G0003 [uncultured bacterium]OGT26782.1 MAG: hypothetical protein A3B71_04050 [Gammaproteobacteria bacterium RIFCSPHIGHO2_02_FULL_42_43]OGT28662.1 MAG: hypothetical protein A2624_06700 [Gammaproteobacteria bacterium RIFCSPHIGHO2_01_FULL_42_8]OGT52910.1 MAG: hypothetical protein A3E54_07475 [Gammaproteobacteria bacterium RIFCSPHIGHO2_12_FULL_41_25]OGT61316.1 MAG: hypothetical protein A3I77_08215 [Gammaproteobacteria bacterium RIFCSPLOWO2_02_FULL_42_14]OGT
MNYYPNQEIGITTLFGKSLRLHYLTLKHSILCIALITIVKFLAVCASNAVESGFLHWLFAIITAFFVVYFFSMALYATHHAFLDSPKSFLESAQSIWQNKIVIYSVFWLYVVGMFVVYYALKFVLEGLMYLFHEPTHLQGVILIICTAFLLVYVAIFYFSYPLSVIEHDSIFSAVQDSMLLSEKNKSGVLVSLMILFLIVLLASPGTMHEYFLSAYHLDGVFDFVLFCVGIPLYINLLLLTIHDTQLQVQ